MTMRMRSLEEPKWALQHAAVGSRRVPSKAMKVVAASPRGQLSAMGGRFTINRVRSTPMGKSRPKMTFLRPRRHASFAWLANLVTTGSRSLFQLPNCLNRRSWNSHPQPDPSCSNRRRT